jgi:transposase InsO family protein
VDNTRRHLPGRKDDSGLAALVHHSDRGCLPEYTAIRYSQRLEDVGVAPSVGTKGDSFDNALAEAVNGLYKAELVGPQGPFDSAATSRRPLLPGSAGGTPPVSTRPAVGPPR